MPTGYTAKIEEGCTFEEFILGCAKAFGALISMRDEPADKPIPDKFEESTYHKDEYNKSVSELKKYEKMSIAEADEEAEKEYQLKIKERKNYLEEVDQKENLYKAMIEKVNNWVSPGSDHDELKSFMLQQIDISMDKGSAAKFCEKDPIIKLSGQQWLHDKLTKIKSKDIEYHMKEWKEETRRTADKNEWVELLRKSIK